jgi:hypothetical protein
MAKLRLVKMKTKFIIKCDSFLNACTVKGYFLEQYACLSLRDSSINIKTGSEFIWVKIVADDIFDRTADFIASVTYLKQNRVKCDV